MPKILSLTQKEILGGMTPFKNDTRFGIFYSADGVNPSISGGGISISASPVEIGSGVMSDNYIQDFVSATDSVYGFGNNGGFYKITNLTASTPTVVNLRSGSAITNPNGWGLESFTTKVGGEKIYYFRTNKIGQLDPSTDLFNDTWGTPSNTAIQHPTFRIEDRLFYGDGYYVSQLSDDLTNADPVNSTQVLDLPQGHYVVGITSDGNYLIVAANSGSNTRLETTIYFWNWKENYVSWDRSWIIQDTFVSMYFKDGITYMLGTHGLWAFTFSNPPQKIRTDIVGIFGYRGFGEYVGSVLIGQNRVVTSYGKLSPQFQTSKFDIVADLTADVTALSSQVSNSRLFLSTSASKMYYADFNTQKVASNDTVSTGYFDIGELVKIERVDLIFTDTMNSGDSVAIRLRASESGAEGIGYADFSTISYANDGGVSSAKSMFTNTALVTDKVSLELTISGTAVIKRIDIYGTKQER